MTGFSGRGAAGKGVALEETGEALAALLRQALADRLARRIEASDGAGPKAFRPVDDGVDVAADAGSRRGRGGAERTGENQ